MGLVQVICDFPTLQTIRIIYDMEYVLSLANLSNIYHFIRGSWSEAAGCAKDTEDLCGSKTRHCGFNLFKVCDELLSIDQRFDDNRLEVGSQDALKTSFLIYAWPDDIFGFRFH